MKIVPSDAVATILEADTIDLSAIDFSETAAPFQCSEDTLTQKAFDKAVADVIETSRNWIMHL